VVHNVDCGWKEQKMHTKFYLGNSKGRAHEHDLGIGGRIAFQ